MLTRIVYFQSVLSALLARGPLVTTDAMDAVLCSMDPELLAAPMDTPFAARPGAGEVKEGSLVVAVFDSPDLIRGLVYQVTDSCHRGSCKLRCAVDGQELTTSGGQTLRVTSQSGQAYLPGLNAITTPRQPPGLTAVTGGLAARNGFIHIINWVPLPFDELLPLMNCPDGKFGCMNPNELDPQYVGYCVPKNTNKACISLSDAPATSVPPTTVGPVTTVLPDLAVMESAWDQANWPGQQFGIFLEALKATGLESVLQGDGPVTVFIPPDATFKSFFDVMGVTKEQVFGDNELLTKIISYLVVTGTNRYTDEDLMKMNGQELTTLGGAKMLITAKYGKIFLPGVNPFPDISQGGPLTNVYGAYRARNGFVLVIDWVPLPPDVKVAQLLKCPSGPFGCVEIPPESIELSRPGYCVETKPLYGCLALGKE
jgi:uncharacterized surface protein with fasciclin (FAS1) repeats